MGVFILILFACKEFRRFDTVATYGSHLAIYGAIYGFADIGFCGGRLCSWLAWSDGAREAPIGLAPDKVAVIIPADRVAGDVQALLGSAKRPPADALIFGFLLKLARRPVARVQRQHEEHFRVAAGVALPGVFQRCQNLIGGDAHFSAPLHAAELPGARQGVSQGGG